MDFLTRFGINKSRLTVLVMIALILQGLITYTALSKREDPAITVRTAVVSAQFPGMSPERIEDLIAVPIERKAREIAEIDDINTLISTGSTVIKLAVHDSVPKNKVDEVQQDVRNKMADIANSLPKGTRGPFVNTSYGNVAIVSVSITGEGYSYAELSDEAEELQEHLYTLDGVGRVSLFGEQDERIYLEIDTRKLAAVGVEIQQVLSDLQSQNVILPAGELDAGAPASCWKPMVT